MVSNEPENKAPQTILLNLKTSKNSIKKKQNRNRKYSEAVEVHHASFTSNFHI